MADALDTALEDSDRAMLAAPPEEVSYHALIPPGMSPEHFERFQQESAYIAQCAF